MKVGIKLLNSDLKVDNIKESNFFVVHVLGILKEKDFDWGKCNKMVKSEDLFNSGLFVLLSGFGF
jgi:hypothetical protein